MRTLRKTISLLLVAVMLILEIPAVAIAADGLVYQPMYNDYPIFSAQTRSSLDQFIGANGNSAFNLVARFTKAYALGSYPAQLDFWTQLTGQNYAYYQMAFNDFEKRIAALGELGVALHAQITNDKHWSANHFFSKETTANILKLSSAMYSHHSNFGKNLHSYDSIEHASSGNYAYTDSGNAFPSTGTGTWQIQGLTLEHRLSGDLCGNANTSNIAVMLADLAGPTVQSVYATADSDPSSAKHDRFKAGETIYVHLKFDEPVRLSTDNAADLAGLTLNMAIADTKTGAQVGGASVTANVVSLIGDTITFKCVVPTTISISGQPVTTNHYLLSVTMSDQSWVTANNNAFDLTYVYEDGTGKHTIAPKDPANNQTLVKTSSLITDFAGNPVARSTTPIYFDKPCYMDNVAPTVVSVTPVAVEKNPNSDFAGTGQTFMTVGDKIEITAEFSEEMQFYNAATRTYGSIATNTPGDPGYAAYRVGYLKAELNLMDDQDHRIVVSGTRAVTSSSGVNGIRTTKVTFELTVPAGARPMTGQEAYPLGIHRIYVDGAPYPLCDSRGNAYNTEALLLGDGGPTITRQLRLDTLAPVVSPQFIGTSGQPDFYLKVVVDDDQSGGATFASGSTGMFGTFEWANGGDGNQDSVYEYAYVSSTTVPDENRTYMQATEGEPVAGLIQLEGDGLYIHFRSLPGQDYSIVNSKVNLQVYDRAGNTGVTTVALDDYRFDNVGPVVTEASRANLLDAVDGAGELTASIRVKDVAGKVAEIEYQWVKWTSDSPPDAESVWQPAAYTEDGVYKTFNASKPGLATGQFHKYSLFVRTLNSAMGEIPEGTTRFDYEYDLEKPEHSLEFVTSPDGFHAKHSIIFTPGPSKEVDMGSGPETRTPTTIVMIKVPGQANRYYVKSAVMPSNSAVESGHPDIFDIPHSGSIDASYFEDWHLAEVTSDETGTLITSIADLYATRGAAGSALPGEHSALQYLMNAYYGELNLRLIAAYEEDLTVEDAETKSVAIPNALVADYSYTLKSAYAGDIYYGDCAYRFEVTPILPDGSEEDPSTYAGRTVLGKSMNTLPPVDDYAEDADYTGMFGTMRSLDGVKLKVELENLKMPDWGTADLAGIYVQIDREYYAWDPMDDCWMPYYDDSLYTTTLPAVASQVFEIPAGVCDEPAIYHIKMFVRSLAESAHSATSRIERTVHGYIEKATVGSYGVVKSTTEVGAGEASVQLEHAYPLGSSPAPEVYLSGSGKTALTFHAEFVPTLYPQVGAAAGEGFTRIYMRLSANGKETGWVRMSASPGDDAPYPYPWAPYGYGEATFSAVALSALGLQDGDELIYEVMTTTGVAAIEWDPDTQKAVTTLEPYSPPARSLTVRISNEPPVLEMQLVPMTPVKSSSGVLATVKSLTSPNSPIDTVVLKYRKGAAGALTDFALGDTITLTENDTYYFFAYDRFGNVTVVTKTVDWIDDSAPTVGVFDNSSGNLFDLTVALDDASSVSLAIQHEEDYWENVLGMPGVDSQDDVPRIVVPGSGEVGTWHASGPNENGIYQVETETTGSTKTVRLKGVFKYDSRLASGAAAPRSIWLIAADAAGNETRTQVDIAATNRGVRCSGHALDPDGGLELTFTAPVKLTSPVLSPADVAYGLNKAGVPTYASGNYDIEYADIFGETYRESIAVNAYDGAHQVDVTISETGPTRNDVVITIDATSNPNDATLELPASDATMTVVPVTVDSKVKGATITVSSNRDVVFGVAAAGTTQTRTIPVANIDRTPPTASVTWTFTDAVVADPDTGKSETKGDVIASLVASESISGTNNKATTHRFAFNDQADYVFEYQDDAGNLGEPVTVSLASTSIGAVQIVEKMLIDVDTDAPAYTMAVSQAMPGGAFIKTAQYTQAEYEAALGSGNPFDDPIHVTRTMRLTFTVTDVNSTKLFVMEGLSPDTGGVSYNNPSTAAISGVSWVGNSVDFTENVSVTVVIVDAKDNMTLIPVTLTKIDNEPPTGEVQLVKVDFFKTRAYLVSLSDNLSATVTVRMTPGVSWDPSYGGGTGAYYHEFVGNGSFEFTIEDASGNTATVTTTVTGIDETVPAASKITWSPPFIGADRIPENSAPPEDRKVATNVIARVEFTKPLITDLCTATLQSPEGVASDFFECVWGSNYASITFTAAAIVKLDFVAQNYMTGTYTVDGSGIRIDKTPPQVTVTSDEPLAGSTRSVKLTITSDEPAWELGSGLAIGVPGQTATLTITKNRDYTYRFADEVGNIAGTFTFVDSVGTATPGTSSITVSNIDSTPPELTVSGFPMTRAEVERWNNEHPGDPRTHTMRNTSFTVIVTTNEPATIAIDDDQVVSGTSATFWVHTNGRYTIRATDAVGNMATKSYTVDCIDKAPPTIVLGAGTLKVKQGTTVAEFLGILDGEMSAKQVYAVDSVDGNVTPTYSRVGDVDLNTPGVYYIEYTAADSAGNTSPAVPRTVMVYDLNAPTIFIDGMKTEPRGATIVNAAGRDTVPLVASMPDPGGGRFPEPFKLYYGAGYRTIGEMKSLGEKLAVTARPGELQLADADLPVPASGFYTLYIVTQSRTEYITYVYVQK